MAYVLPSYSPEDWYWFIGADTANVWSSGRCMSVPVDDATYVEWLATFTTPSTAVNMAAVEEALRVPFPAGTLRTYAADARYRKAGGGVIISSLSPVAFLSDILSRNAINSIYDYLGTVPPTTTVQWKMSDGSFVTLDRPKVLTMMQLMASFVISCFDCESTLVDGIDAETITTLAQIDSAFSAISNVFA